ncbi:MAG: 2TM domain-containing protein [Leptolyngbya sp. SIO1D8]|nr:2TM domain-containing protein [Leptolyngbya sp. SIO1D8]
MTEPTTATVPGEDNPEIYQSEDAQAILQIAIARHTEEGALTRAQLLEIGEELGISATTLAEAEQEWQLQCLEKADLKAFDEFQKQRLQSHLLRFVVLNALLLTVNFMLSSELSWAIYILLFWGTAIGLQTWQTFQPNQHRYREEFEKWRRRQQLKRSFNRFVDWLLGT